MTEPRPEDALAHAARELRRQARRFALVNGIAVSLRAEERFTRDVDLAISVSSDAEFEALIYALTGAGYRALTTLEHETTGRLATVRTMSPSGFVVDLLAASCGIEHEIVEAATDVEMEVAGRVPVARSEDLLAMKLLSSRVGRERDWQDARSLVQTNPELDLDLVRARLGLITTRGYARKEDLAAKLEKLLVEVRTAP